MKNEFGEIADGGPAFPINEADSKQHDGYPGFTAWTMGMSRRDYFAAAAMSSLIGPELRYPPDSLAATAYDIADAMIRKSNE